MCGGDRLVVQQSVYQLMWRLRQQSEPITLWVDAICIDQSNRSERNSQVEMMDRIYTSAETVVIWVGEENERTPMLAEYLKRVESALNNGEHARARKHGDSPQKLHAEEMSWRRTAEWTDLGFFLDRPWFTRTWVLQEVSLAPSCVLRCGSYVWKWPNIQRMFCLLAETTTVDVMGIKRRMKQGVVEFSSYWENHRTQSPSVLELLAATKGTHASWPVDKVYAILRLASDPLGIQVDYDRSVQQVYKDVAGRLLQNGYLETLYYASDSVWNEVPGLPSWVPDWACIDKPRKIETSQGLDLLNGVFPQNSRVVSSDGPRIQIQRSLLQLDVVKVDQVLRTGVPWSGNQRSATPLPLDLDVWDIGLLALSRIQEWHRMLWKSGNRKQSRYSATSEDCTAAFMRTIVADSVALPEGFSKWEEVYPVLKERLNVLRRRKAHAFHSELFNKVDHMKDYHEAIKTFCHKRTFFLTKKGCMGLGPFFTLPYDRVVLMPGLNTAFSLRRTLRGRYRLIGQCYVHGLDNVLESTVNLPEVETIVMQ